MIVLPEKSAGVAKFAAAYWCNKAIFAAIDPSLVPPELALLPVYPSVAGLWPCPKPLAPVKPEAFQSEP